MSQSPPRDTTSGTIEEVAAFFRVSVRTVADWKAQSPPVITFWQQGRNVTFHEEGVIELKVKEMVKSRAMKPGEAEEIARREWREHLKVARADLIHGELQVLRKELAELKRKVEGSELRVERGIKMEAAA